MQHDPRAHLADVLDAAARIDRFTEGVEFDGYTADDMRQSAVERQLEIIGEALNRLRRDSPELTERIADVPRIVGLRNVIAHGYDIVDHEAVWDAIRLDLPGLVAAVSALLAELDAAHADSDALPGP